MRYILPFLLIHILVLIAHDASAQGCSDAGVCTAGPIGEMPSLLDSVGTAEEPRHYARLTFSYAVGERSTTIFQVVPELGIGITDRWGAQLRLPYMSISGDLGSNSGLGDAVVTTSYAFIKNDKQRLDAMVGLKAYTTDAAEGERINEMSVRTLPMVYQRSLGTTDLLLGVNYRHGRWSGALAWQHVLTDKNANQFDHINYAATDAEARAYEETLFLRRADDLVVRLQYAQRFGKLTVQPGLLAIQHLGTDTRLDAGSVNWVTQSLPRVDIEGSDGLTLNLTADARYKLSDTWALEASFGSPLVTREARPDGLTRALVANMGLRFAF